MTRAPRPQRLPRTVVFDMDGLMLDTERLALRCWTVAAERLGLEFDAALIPAMIGRNSRDSRVLVLERHGDAFPIDRLMQASQEAYDAIVAHEGVAVKPGLVALLDWLDGRRIPRVVATSTRRARALAKLAPTGLLSRFAALVGGDEVAEGKPAPDIFLRAAASVGTSPADCIVLEDSEPGVRGALAAGMIPIMVPDTLEPSADLLARGILVLPSLAAVQSHLAALPG
jgi:HAD superfamily hydrolase (TIGR01509 family)